MKSIKNKSIYWFQKDSALHAPETKLSVLQRVILPLLGRGAGKGQRAATSSSLPCFGCRRLGSLWWPSGGQEVDAMKKTSLQRLSCSGRTAGKLPRASVYCLRRPPRRERQLGKTHFPSGLYFISTKNEHRKQDREEVTTENARGLYCCEESQGEIKFKAARPVPFNV